VESFLHSSQKGFAHILLIVAAVGVVVFVLVLGLAPFRNNLLTALYQKKSSFAAGGPAVSNITIGSAMVKAYEKEEIKFDVATNSQYPFMAYDTSPPPGVTAGLGVTVEGVFTANGKTWKQPAFYMTETVKNGSGSSMYFTETGKKYWVLRFSPQEVGTYQVTINATDSSGTSSTNAGSFTATAATKKGFIKVSQDDSRYFEFSNGDLFYPIGPANLDSNNSYAGYKDNGPNLERPWMGGLGVYSTNWARWKSSGENLGNEGIMTRLNWQEKLPGHDLSYELFYPTGDRFWIGTWLDDAFGPRVVSGKKYSVKFVYKTANLAGPRVAGQPFGLTVKTSDYAPWGNPGSDTFDSSLRGTNTQIIVPHVTSNQNWTTVNTTFTSNANRTNLYVYLDNVTAGNAYIDELSIRECVDTSCTNLGGEIVRNPRADEHLFIEQRPAAFIDWQLDQGEQNGVFFKYVVHDKNDWIQNHLKADGSWTATGDGYYQDENTKARWLLRQWYRYIAARWGYSTSVHSWELNNEGAPNEEAPGTSSHWRTAQAFAKFMHDNDVHRHLATTSFWCCWRPAFWGNKTAFPDIDYADLHMYTSNPDGIAPVTDYDMALWTYNTSLSVYNNGYPTGQKGVGKPIMRGETGTSGVAYDLMKNPNPGVWYHNLLWGQLNEGAMSDPNYWWGEHFSQINRSAIAKPFWTFIKDLDWNKGGYNAVGATSTNTNLRVFGLKNLTKNKSQIWIQNATHTWKNVMDGTVTAQSGTVTVTMKPSNSYTVESWNTYTGVVSGTQSLSSDATGKLVISINNLSDDVAIKISGPASSTAPSPSIAASPIASSSPVVSPSPVKPGDIDGNNKVDIFDYNILLTNFGQTGSGIQGDLNGSGKVDIFDYNILLTNFGK
jgi:hypothetical protein